MKAHATILGIREDGHQKVLAQGEYVSMKTDFYGRYHGQFYKLFFYASNGVTISRRMIAEEQKKVAKPTQEKAESKPKAQTAKPAPKKDAASPRPNSK